MLYELEVLETRRIAELAGELHEVRDRLLEKVPKSRLGEPPPARGEHNPLTTLDLDATLTRTPAFAALHDAIAALPRDMHETLWAIAQTGGGPGSTRAFESLKAEAQDFSDQALANSLLGEPELQRMLTKGLYQLGAEAPASG